MSLLTTAQLTFVDLKDSYSIHIDNECIGIACDYNELVLETQEIKINYRVLVGADRVSSTCEVSEFPSGVTLKSNVDATDTQDGTITLSIAKNASLNGEQSSSIKLVFTTQNDEKFTFERYVTFVKCMTGADGENGRGIQNILEYYLVSPDNENVTTSTSGWSTNIPTLDSTNKYLWNYEVTEFNTGETDVTEPIIIGVYGETGASLQVKYISSATVPTITNNDVSGWSDTMPTVTSGKTVYMTQKLSTATNWSTPVQISATDGTTPTITISNGYWYINGEATGVKAEGEDGENGNTPTITVGTNGNWYIDGVDSGTQAQGEAGKDGASVEYVYYRSENAITLSAPSYSSTTLTSGWTASPQGITETYKYEYVSVRNKPSGGSWGAFSTPVIWSKWGEKGQDGDGVEYKYYLSNSSTAPTYSTGASGWTDDPTGVSSTKQYEYVVQITTSNGTSTASSPALWAKFGANGTNGVGISSITNYYQVTSTATTPTSWIENTAPEMSNTDKFLWNYEKITYTDGTSTSSDAAIIGVYGDSAITMKVYPVSGLTFKEDLTELELKVAAFEGTTAISGATYQWQYWDKTLNNNAGGYVNIDATTTQALIVHASDVYALSGLRCVMTYNGQTYEDYISLINETMIYTAVVKFFGNSNTFEADDDYLAAYIELYQNNNLVETLAAGQRCTGIASISSSGVITANFKDEATSNFVDGATMYFIYEDGDGDDTSNGKYKVALGQYSTSTAQWKKIDYSTQYTYTNSLYPSYPSNTNVIVIAKEKINKSQNIDFTVYKDNTDIAHAHTMIIDVNDPIISSTEPQNPKENQLWLNTSENPNILYVYSKAEGKWIKCAEHAGRAFYTSRPTSYREGDAWILAAGETCEYTKDGVTYKFEAGSMLKSTASSDTFNASHWIDADAEGTQVKENLKQFFEFSSTNGLKIGQADNAFYVNISSQKMNFNSVGEDGTPSEVVQIGINSATIQNTTLDGSTTVKQDITVEGKATFNKQVDFFGFMWQKEESNGSLSLVIGN